MRGGVPLHGLIPKPKLNPAIAQYNDKFMVTKNYGNLSVALNDTRTSASGTQDDDFAIVERKVSSIGSVYNFEVIDSSNKDFGVGLV